MKQKQSTVTKLLNVVQRHQPGYALVITLVIIVLVTSILTGLLFSNAFYYKLARKSALHYTLKLAGYSAVQKCFAVGRIPEDTMYVTNEGITLRVKKMQFGVLPYISVSCAAKYDTVTQFFIAGTSPDTLFSPAITFSDPSFNGTITGTTRIIGDLVSQSGQVRTSQIFGIPSPGGNPVTGKNINRKMIRLKLFDESVLSSLYSTLTNNQNHSAKIQGDCILSGNAEELLKTGCGSVYINGNLIVKGDINLKNHLHSQMIVNGNVIIENQTLLTGNYLSIFCTGTVLVKPDCKLLETAIIANDSIVISDNCSLEMFQAISKKSVAATKSLFKYHSALLLYTTIPANASNDKPGQITLHQSIVNGEVCLITPVTSSTGNRSSIIIDNYSTVHGVLYSENRATIEGKVLGSVYTYTTWYEKEPTIYQNWLINTYINRSSLDPSFASIPYYFGNTNYRVITQGVVR